MIAGRTLTWDGARALGRALGRWVIVARADVFAKLETDQARTANTTLATLPASFTSAELVGLGFTVEP